MATGTAKNRRALQPVRYTFPDRPPFVPERFMAVPSGGPTHKRKGIPTELALGVRRRGRERTRYSTYFLAKGSVLHALPFLRDAHPQSPRSFRRGPGKQPRSAARTPPRGRAPRALAWTPPAFSRATCKFRSLPPSHALRKL